MFVKLTERPQLGDIVYLHPPLCIAGQTITGPKPLTITRVFVPNEVEVSWFVLDGSMHQIDVEWRSLYKKLPPEVSQINKAD